jgi:hypothetical protein
MFSRILETLNTLSGMTEVFPPAKISEFHIMLSWLKSYLKNNEEIRIVFIPGVEDEIKNSVVTYLMENDIQFYTSE